MSDIVRLAIAVVVPQLVGVVVAFGAAREARRWYPALRKPVWAPPPEAFGPVWTGLYLSMGLASFVVWDRGLDVPSVRWALAAYGVQLLLAGVQPVVFFRLRSPLLGLLAALAWWAVGLFTALLFFRVSAAGGWLFVPVVVWTCYALALAWSIRRLDRG